LTIAAVAEPLEEAGASASAAGESKGGKTSASLGSASRLFPTPKTEHPYVVGFVLVLIGITGLIGSITGALPAMIAALFVPDALEEATTQKSVVATTLSAAENSAIPGFGLLGDFKRYLGL
jgi:hypothetical protein